uniref:Putative secreted protein n=1 Tax=Anopheles marajoara TaxID=58244 RepID=A0A2M4CF34_9DIPT
MLPSATAAAAAAAAQPLLLVLPLLASNDPTLPRNARLPRDPTNHTTTNGGQSASQPASHPAAPAISLR